MNSVSVASNPSQTSASEDHGQSATKGQIVRQCPESNPSSLPPPPRFQLLLLCKCANTTKWYTTLCMCVSFSQTFSKGFFTQFTTTLDPSNDARLDHSSGTRWPICKKVCLLDSTTIYPKTGHALLYTPMIGEKKCPTNIPLPCTFYFISSIIDATHAPTISQTIWSTSYHHVTLLVHRSWP